MARTFGDPYDIEVPLRTTWQEQVLFQDATGVPIVIDSLKARGQLCEVIDYDANGNKIYGAPILTLATADGSIVIPADGSGTLNINIPSTTTDALSPDNLRLQADYDIELYDDTVSPQYVEPALAGSITFVQRVG